MEKYDYPAPWECKALVAERGNLERLRDRRVQFGLDNEEVAAEFHDAVIAFVELENNHMVETGCRDHH